MYVLRRLTRGRAAAGSMKQRGDRRLERRRNTREVKREECPLCALWLLCALGRFVANLQRIGIPGRLQHYLPATMAAMPFMLEESSPCPPSAAPAGQATIVTFGASTPVAVLHKRHASRGWASPAASRAGKLRRSSSANTRWEQRPAGASSIAKAASIDGLSGAWAKSSVSAPTTLPAGEGQG